jgi:hypothetical protein
MLKVLVAMQCHAPLGLQSAGLITRLQQGGALVLLWLLAAIRFFVDK